MLKVILPAPRYIPPFNEAARDLRIQNKPLWLNQRDLLAPLRDERTGTSSWRAAADFARADDRLS